MQEQIGNKKEEIQSLKHELIEQDKEMQKLDVKHWFSLITREVSLFWNRKSQKNSGKRRGLGAAKSKRVSKEERGNSKKPKLVLTFNFVSNIELFPSNIVHLHSLHLNKKRFLVILTVCDSQSNFSFN